MSAPLGNGLTAISKRLSSVSLLKVKEAGLVCLGQVIVYALICYNIRAVAQADYLGTAVSDALFATVNFLIIRHITKGDDATHKWVGYVVGSVVGSMLGIYISTIL